MKNFLAALLFSLLFSITLAFAQTTFPQYKSVVNRFFNEYAPADLSSSEFINFEKRPEGWMVVLYDYDVARAELVGRSGLLYWSEKKNTFEELLLQKKDETHNAINIGRQLLRQDVAVAHYRFNPYYGYKEWANDVIRLLEGKEGLNDTLTHALSYSYSNKASEYINLNFSFRENLLQKSNSSLSAIAAYCSTAWKGIEAGRRLLGINPRFVTAIGTTPTQLGNDYMSAWLNLWMLGAPDSAKQFIIQGLYPPAMIDMAKNYLASCAPHAILFTNGDNDTYPLLYVQQAMHWRTDVNVINLSLLNADKFIYRVLSEDTTLGKIDPALYEGRINDVVLLSGNGKEEATITLNSFLQKIYTTKPADAAYPYPKIELEGKIYIPVKKKTALTLVQPEDKGLVADKVILTIDRDYILKSQWVVLYLIDHCLAKRPVYFATSVATNECLGLDKYFQQEGLTHRLVPITEPSSDGLPGRVQTKVFNNNVFNTFSDSHLAEGEFPYESSESRIVMNTRSYMLRLAQAFERNGEKASAIAVLKKMNEILPGSKVPYGLFNIMEAELYYKMDMLKEGNQLGNTLTDMYVERLERFKNMPADKRNAYQRDINEGIYILMELTQYSINDKELHDKASLFFDRYKDLYVSGGQTDEE